ncbi:ribokinase [Enterococcus sp. SMC-9]|uniref:ribokinase n=1 Tax=Enterococcus sp. SMC-9 TaxID=2862343 RepID=UPI001E447EC1|nr:ribokinase [Enterococcus sp. SMC-9]MCD1024017.1 ribokinase [Enterococcus sp. SMC-9]
MKITVVGSMSTDFVVTTNIKPDQGETVFGEKFATAFGGKGANQAVAASRLGVEVAMVGAVGSDDFGTAILNNLVENGVDVSCVERVTHVESGSAHIVLYDHDNSIIVIPAANNEVKPSNIEKFASQLLNSDLVILQNEIPQATNEAIIDFCWEHGIKTLLNPAPARPLAKDYLEKITYLTPNEHESAIIFPDQSRSQVLAKYPNKLVITLGAMGAIYHDGKKEEIVPAFEVQPVDTTGAGDTFNAAMATALLYGLKMSEALRFANLAAAISVQGFGAQGGMPTLEKMKEQPQYEKTWHFK